MSTSHRRTVRHPRNGVIADEQELERYLTWVARPETKKYLSLTQDALCRNRVDSNNPMAAQDALCKQKHTEGVQDTITMLLNLDDPDAMSEIVSGEPEMTWGADDQPHKGE